MEDRQPIIDNYIRLYKNWNPTLVEYFLLPVGIIGKDLEDPKYAHLSDLKIVLLGIVLLIILRIFLERYVFNAFGRKIGVCKGKTPEHPDQVLFNNIFIANGRKVTPKIIHIAVKQSGRNEREVQRFFRQLRLTNSVTLYKFCECMFRLVFYTGTFCYGFYNLMIVGWVFNMEELWKNMPFHEVMPWAYHYYIVELSYYASGLITMPFDTKRKDYYIMMIHHFATVCLIVFSYYSNFWRVGTVIMMLHDFSDIFLETGKIFTYAKVLSITDAIFAVFAIVFFLSRLVYFPFIVLRSVIFDLPMIYVGIQFFEYVKTGFVLPVHFIYIGLLGLLLMIHVIWFSIIVKMFINMIRNGKVGDDSRSDGEDIITDFEDESEKDQYNDVKDDNLRNVADMMIQSNYAPVNESLSSSFKTNHRVKISKQD